MNLFKSIKKAFDPNNILNPFKMGLWCNYEWYR
jgi:glycolate oxidase